MDDKQLIAFHGDQVIKDKYIARVKAHQLADEIQKGFYWEGGKGCAVGCTIQGPEHDRYETELGIPQQIAFIEDGLFEALPNEDAKAFPLQFLEAIPVGADLSLVVSHLMFDLLLDPEKGLIALPDLADDAKRSIELVGECYKRRLAGDEPSAGDWEVAGTAARDARAARAAWAAWAARDARAARAAWAAWAARAAWAAWAAWAARDARDARAARDAIRIWQRDCLLHHLSNAPVVVRSDG